MIPCNRQTFLSTVPEGWGKTARDYAKAAGRATKAVSGPQSSAAKGQRARFDAKARADEKWARELLR